MKNNTINKKEIEKFSKIAEEWWNPEGKFKPLHKFNPTRIEFIKKNIIKEFNIKNKKNPLSNLNVFTIFSFKYEILIGLNLCKGLNLPSGSHHSSAILENFSISFLFIVLFFISKLTLYSTCIYSIFFNI